VLSGFLQIGLSLAMMRRVNLVGMDAVMEKPCLYIHHIKPLAIVNQQAFWREYTTITAVEQ
jgi:hypothetical protein